MRDCRAPTRAERFAIMTHPRYTEDDLRQFQKNRGKVRGGVGGCALERDSPRKRNSRESVPNPAPSPLVQTFFIPGPLPGANDIIRKHHMVYSRLKSQWGLTIARCIIVAKLKRVQACTVAFLWQEKDNRRDDDNVMFAQKFVLDALRDTKIIPDDRRRYIHALIHQVIVEPTNPGVTVTVVSAPS